MSNPADKITAELIALADACMTLSRNIGETHMLDEPGEEWALEQKLSAAKAALEQAIRRAVDWKLVACVVEPMHGNNGITWGREAHLNPPPVGTPLYARSQQP